MTKLTGRFIPALLGFRPTGDLGPLTIYTSKRGKIVAYPKAPPTSPPTFHQLRNRNRFRLVALLWSNLLPAERNQWTLAAHRTGASITGYNLFVFYQMTHDEPPIRTIERQTHTTLLP